VQLRYSYRLCPTAGQCRAPARAFGCARVVYNDALRLREDARAAGEQIPKSGELSKRVITEAKKSPERAWLGEVSAVALQQSLRDLDAAYKNFFDSLAGRRKSPKPGPPRFKSRKDNRQAVRFTANARWKITDAGKLSLPKVRDGQVANRPIYVALAVTVDGTRDILGLWAGDGGEGAKYWLQVLTEIKNRGVADGRSRVAAGSVGACSAARGRVSGRGTFWSSRVVRGGGTRRSAGGRHGEQEPPRVRNPLLGPPP
jgi:hypothetical protein